MAMQKINYSEALKFKILDLEYQIKDDFIILKDAFIYIDVQLPTIKILKYTTLIMLNAWLPIKGKQLIALASNIYKVIIR
jgi:hypothetical protein